jgi:hypothetical protein
MLDNILILPSRQESFREARYTSTEPKETWLLTDIPALLVNSMCESKALLGRIVSHDAANGSVFAAELTKMIRARQ